MLVVSSREFRENQKKYMDLADNNEQVIVQRGKEKAYVLVPISEKDRFFLDPEVLEDIKVGISQYNTGNTIKVDKSDFDKLLGL
ncbi:type II toxin-antitoxin system Phd/YefM family antitoxin [Aquiflexum sp. LQ15W]|uniref:type II toxin-antitoxin system prevent-host-death family antitoxin n=1 Tax=Cognataquiflexum TaxID=3020066 RepID=UPI001F12FD4E|nr:MULTISPECIES: type II toxin-antitoxin system prevent-host-death family antitoxin [Cognataquiflexum]MCH6198903.1 type II toxin-antitoxin system Phd/YefM family antitoxin [Cognataquiflexum nitidum]MCH6233656.1 type II toxin-antitoxin system Phd/YefM family antitoxin [Cognataquiflexum rubidum]